MRVASISEFWSVNFLLIENHGHKLGWLHACKEDQFAEREFYLDQNRSTRKKHTNQHVIIGVIFLDLSRQDCSL